MRTSARAVVIGGGVGGCAVLYWLARLGWEDVLLVERAELDERLHLPFGRVGRAAARPTSLTRMMMRSVELYRALGGGDRPRDRLREVGSLRLASTSG